MELQKIQQKQELATASTFSPHLQKLTSSILKLEVPELKTEGKMELMTICRQLLPEGKPKYLDVIKFDPIRDLIVKMGAPKMHKLLILIIQDFCNSLNVVRNMNEDQIIEAAGMLLDECDNFRIEDYLMMFQMAKRGELIKIYDRIDMQVITQIFDEYWKRRSSAGHDIYRDEVMRLDSLGPIVRRQDSLSMEESKMESGFNRLSDSLETLRHTFTEFKSKEDEK